LDENQPVSNKQLVEQIYDASEIGYDPDYENTNFQRKSGLSSHLSKYCRKMCKLGILKKNKEVKKPGIWSLDELGQEISEELSDSK
jgi:hypothetical protein